MLTKESVVAIHSNNARALRKADTLVFHFQKGEHFIRAIKTERDEFGTKDREIRIDVQGRVEKYRVREHDLGEVEECSAIISSAQFDKALQTALAGIRAGDILVLRWVANNNSQYLDKAGLFQDHLYLQVHRGALNHNVKEYLISSSITPNNSAKMCKHTSTPFLRY